MSAHVAAGPVPSAHTHADAIALFRRPFAPGAVGFRAMSKVPHRDDPWGGAQVAAYIGAQSVLQRLNHVVPGRWRMSFTALDGDLAAAAADGHTRRKLYLACRLHVTLPEVANGPEVDAVYEDIGECDAGSLAGLKALYSDARKRAAVAAGIGAYLYTALAAVVLPIGPGERHVQCLRRSGKSDLLLLSPTTEAWLRDGYRTRMNTPAVLRDLGAILAHGEPDDGVGQGEIADDAAHPTPEPTADTPAPEPAAAASTPTGNGQLTDRNGEVVRLDFGGLGLIRPTRGMSARARLAALAAAAEYGPDALGVIADAALPTHRPGQRLDELRVAHIASAVEVLAQCGHSACVLPNLVAYYRERHGERCWREHFWRAQLRIATLRHRHPRFYGISPCATHAGRLAPQPTSAPDMPLARAA